MTTWSHGEDSTHKLLGFSNFCEVSLDLQAKRGTNELPAQAVIPGPNPYLPPLTKPRPDLDGRRSLGCCHQRNSKAKSLHWRLGTELMYLICNRLAIYLNFSNPHTEDMLNYHQFNKDTAYLKAKE
jgi:hypothetical protein